MKIISEVRQYDTVKSMNCALGQFRRREYPGLTHTNEKDRHYLVEVTRHRYPFVESVLRKLAKMKKEEAA